MKKLTLTMICAMLLSIVLTGVVQAQNQKTKTKAKSASASKADNSPMPYTVTYSSKFEMGDPANSRLVMEMWKDFDDNAFERHENMIADTAVIFLSDGEVIKGRDNMMTGVKTYRNSLADVKTDVHAVMSIRSVDRNENWVAIWGTENDTSKDGTKMSSNLHEIWLINKDGKVAVIRQFSSKTPPAQ